MPHQRVTRKWRPSLGLVIGGALAGVLAVPLIGIGYFRLAGNVLGWAETAWLIFWIAVISTLILGFLLWRLVLRPVLALTAYARAMKAGRVDTPVPAHFGTPEFSDLGQSVIDMGVTLHNRADGMRAYADHVTHELKSPLTAITGAAELLQGTVVDEDRAALADAIHQAAKRMENLLTDLRRHAAAGRSSAGGRADLADAAAAVLGIDVVVQRGGTLPIAMADLTAVLVQLAQNAVAHGADTLTLTWQDGTLLVHDNGHGVAPGNRDRLFVPFFTTTRSAGGTGMGLPIVRALVEAQGGRIELADAAKGTTFAITL